MTFVTGIFVLVISYLLGSIPFGLILGKLVWRTDLRLHGSRNIGATNAWRVIGHPAGVIVFLCDFLKGAIAVGIAYALSEPDATVLPVLAAMTVILGHAFSFLVGFHGGKGVATGLGVVFVLMPPVAVIALVVWLAIVGLTRYVSLGSCVAAFLVPVLAWAMSYPWATFLFGVAGAVLVIARHRENISRLMNGTENKV